MWLSEIGEQRLGHINLQVSNEFTRWLLKNERRLSLEEVRDEVDLLRNWGHQPLDSEDLELAWEVRRELRYQWFDCLLIGAAARMGCGFFLSEDMSDGARFGPLILVDPFKHSPTDILQQH